MIKAVFCLGSSHFNNPCISTHFIYYKIIIDFFIKQNFTPFSSKIFESYSDKPPKDIIKTPINRILLQGYVLYEKFAYFKSLVNF